VSEPALTPALALDYLDELSTDIRGAVLLDASGAVAAAWRGDDERADRLREPLADLLGRADAAAAGAGPATQVEVTTQRGAVFCVRDERWTLAAVTGRFALPSLVFYDLRHVLDDLEPAGDR
jgi:predicted regulator of Ras-like GTPase activity (Roadblock/LC7/MglB family)